MNRNDFILGIVLIWSYRNSLFILFHYCLNITKVLLTKSDFWSSFELKLLRFRIIYETLVLVLVFAFEPWLLFNFNLKSRWENFMFCFRIIKLKIALFIVLILGAFHDWVSGPFSEFHSLWLSKDKIIRRSINWSLSRFSQKIVLRNLWIELNLEPLVSGWSTKTILRISDLIWNYHFPKWTFKLFILNLKNLSWTALYLFLVHNYIF